MHYWTLNNNYNLIIYFLCVGTTATRPITETAQEHEENTPIKTIVIANRYSLWTIFLYPPASAQYEIYFDILNQYSLRNTSYLLTYLLTPWSRDPLEKLTGFCS